MSNLGLLTKEEDALAASQGWGVHHIYELETQKWVIRILPSTVAQSIVNLARQGNPLATKALRLVMHGPEGKK